MLKVSDSFLEQSQIDQNKSIDDSDDIHIDDSAVSKINLICIISIKYIVIRFKSFMII